MDQAPPAQALESSPGRPTAITIICVFGFIGGALNVLRMFTEAGSEIAPWYPQLLAATGMIRLACMAGLWMMRRWAVYVYTALVALIQAILISTGLWQPDSLIIHAITIVVMFIYLPRMR